MTITATKRIALATLAAPVMTALAIGLASGASADAGDTGASVTDTISQLKSAGHTVVINRTGTAGLGDCTLITTRTTRHEHHGGPQSDKFNTAYVDVNCTTTK